MIKIVAAVRRKPGMTHAEFLNYVEHQHGKIALAKPLGVKRYVQNHILDAAFGVGGDNAYHQSFHKDSITELFFEDVPGLIRTFSDPYTQQTTGPDAQNFADLSEQVAQLMVEVEAPGTATGQGPCKAMIFLKKAPGIELDDFFSAWDSAHESVIRELPAFQNALERYVSARYLPEGDKITAYFGPKVIAYEGVASLWLANETDLATFREYQRALLQQLGEAGVALTSASFFAYVKEVVIFDHCA